MRLRLIACEIFARPIYALAAESPHVVDIELVQRGLHLYPAKLRNEIQSRIDQNQAGRYEAILLGYGLCGMAAAGLKARELPLVLPRAHDCITFFLGSRARYNQEFTACPGTYWYTLDSVEREDESGATLSMGAGTDLDLQSAYQDYIQKYGKDNADYLMEAMGAWQSHYRRAAAIDLGVGNFGPVEARARADAGRRNWEYEEIQGNLGIFKRLLWGEWDADFLRVPPGKTIAMEPGENILTAA